MRQVQDAKYEAALAAISEAEVAISGEVEQALLLLRDQIDGMLLQLQVRSSLRGALVYSHEPVAFPNMAGGVLT